MVENLSHAINTGSEGSSPREVATRCDDACRRWRLEGGTGQKETCVTGGGAPPSSTRERSPCEAGNCASDSNELHSIWSNFKL